MCNRDMTTKLDINLFIAGFLKCGTTSLAKYLSVHPDVTVPEIKELYYFVDDKSHLKSYQKKLTWAVENIPDVTSKYYLDATPFYYSQSKVLKYCGNKDNVKVIFLTRNPVERLKSSFRFFSEMYQEYPDSSFEEFAQALLSEGVDVKYKRDISSDFFVELFGLELDMGNYAKHIEKWESTLGKSRVLVMSLESMKANSLQFMKNICDFLSINDQVYQKYSFSPYMRSHSVRNKRLQRWLRKIGKEDMMRYEHIDEYHNPFHFIKNKLIRKIMGSAILKLQYVNSSNVLSNATKRLISYYENSNQVLYSRYGIDYRIIR